MENKLESLIKREEKAKCICSRLNNFIELKPTLIEVIEEIKALSGCEAVSIRLHEDGDYPYYVYNGFPRSFIKKENSLCSKSADGRRIPSPDGEGYLLDCMCGNIIRGRFDPNLPFFTEKGSFWSNNTSVLLASTTEEDRQSKTRNYCNSCGYESVALVPIRSETKNIGLVQMNDKRMGMFSKDTIEFIEMLCDQIGLSVANSYQYEKIVEQKNEISRAMELLKKAQTQLIEAEKMASLGNLVAGVAHEIGTPVGVGITAVTTLIGRNRELRGLYEAQDLTPLDLESYMDLSDTTASLILKNLRRSSDLVNTFKKVAVDHSNENKRVFRVRNYFEDVVRSVEPELKKKNVDVKIICDDDFELYGYPGAFAQILINLLQNSLFHGFRNTKNCKAFIHFNSFGNENILTYEDNGCGIPDDIKGNIFEPFFSTQKSQGTGLGMHIVYNLVTQKMKGTISLSDREEKNGVKFIISIPEESK